MSDPPAFRRRKLASAALLGRALRDRRRHLGWTQTELARRAGVSRPWISEIENGKPTAQLDRLLLVVSALDLDLSLHQKTCEFDMERWL